MWLTLELLRNVWLAFELLISTAGTIWVLIFIFSALYAMATGLQLNQYLQNERPSYSRKMQKYGFIPTKYYFEFIFGDEYFDDDYLKILKKSFRRSILIMFGIFMIPIILLFLCLFFYVVILEILPLFYS